MLLALKEKKFVQILEEPVLVEEVMGCDAEPLKTGTVLKYIILFERYQASPVCPDKKNAGTRRVWSIGGIY
jgi:hypothetical protein